MARDALERIFHLHVSPGYNNVRLLASLFRVLRHALVHLYQGHGFLPRHPVIACKSAFPFLNPAQPEHGVPRDRPDASKSVNELTEQF